MALSIRQKETKKKMCVVATKRSSDEMKMFTRAPQNNIKDAKALCVAYAEFTNTRLSSKVK